MPGKSILLLLCTFFVLSIGLSTTGYAEKPDNGKGKPDKSGTTCERNFCIRFEDDHEVTRDDVVEPGEPGEPEEYCHRTDKVLAFTGKGPGFHFDTTQSGKGKTMTRSLDIDLTVFDVDGFADGDPGLIRVDLRFDRSVNGGLDLCSLKLDESKQVALNITFEVKGAIDNANTLAYGVPIGPELISCGTPVTVTRIADDIWTIVATNACLREGAVDVNFRPIIDSGDGFLGKDASFSATLTVD